MSTLAVQNIRRPGEVASRSTRGISTAWANINGTGTAAIRDSENVASLVDNGTGLFTFNLVNAMANTNYGQTLSGKRPSLTEPCVGLPVTVATGSLATGYGAGSFTLTDPEIASFAIHGSLA